jgi:hypothetical protein
VDKSLVSVTHLVNGGVGSIFLAENLAHGKELQPESLHCPQQLKVQEPQRRQKRSPRLGAWAAEVTTSSTRSGTLLDVVVDPFKRHGRFDHEATDERTGPRYFPQMDSQDKGKFPDMPGCRKWCLKETVFAYPIS